jgi:hypothetical protein
MGWPSWSGCRARERIVMPPFSSIGGIARMRQTFGGEEGLARMLASLNAAVFDAASGGDAAEARPFQ